MPIYEYICRACGHDEEHLQPLGAGAPGPCAACGGELRRRWSRVAVKYQDWGFTSTDKLLPARTTAPCASGPSGSPSSRNTLGR